MTNGREFGTAEFLAPGRSIPSGEWPPARRRKQALAELVLLALLMLGVVTLAILIAPAPAPAAELAVGVSVNFGPPPLPVYAQPPCPGPGYIWTPGYWAYDPDGGYYWVPGAWVVAPAPGLLWTPGYWGWSGAAFIWHGGYWGPHVGFYGGINYGFGYPGVGFVGGEWRGREFFYNRAVNNFGGVHITNVYYRQVNHYQVNRVSFNGGAGGINVRPSRFELAAEREGHFEPTAVQRDHVLAARHERAQFANVNHGRPAFAATPRVGEFHGTASPGKPGEFHANDHNMHGYSHSPSPYSSGNREGMNHPNSPAPHSYNAKEQGERAPQYHETHNAPPSGEKHKEGHAPERHR